MNITTILNKYAHAIRKRCLYLHEQHNACQQQHPDKKSLSALTKNVISMIALCTSVGSYAIEPVPLDRIIAIVNNVSITWSELISRQKSVETRLKEEKIETPPQAELRRQILERLIFEQIQLQYAHTQDMRIDDNTLERAITRVQETNRITPAQLREQLRIKGTTYHDFREELRRELILNNVRERISDTYTQVSESEISQLLATDTTVKQLEEFRISHILIRTPENATEEQLHKQTAKLKLILNRLTHGDDFSKLAATYSDAPDALKGGSLGWRVSDNIPALFLNAIKNLKPGQIAPVQRSNNGLHIIQLSDYRKSGVAPLEEGIEQNRTRHILIRTNALVNDDIAQKKLQDIRNRMLLQGESFSSLAKEFSEDSSNAFKGGDLGWSLPGRFVPEFEQALKQLAINEISQPVKTLFGWHLIQVLDRRAGNLPEDARRDLARNVIRERKAESVFLTWLNEQRDKAFIDIKLD